MVKLPTYENQRQLSTGTEFFRLADDDGGRALARGLHSVAEGINRIGVEIEEKNSKLDTFAAQKELLDLEERTDGYITNEASNIPETGKGFHRSTMAVIQKDVEAVLERIPENLRPEYEVKLKQFLVQRSDQLRNIEFQQGKSYISEISKRTIDRMSKNVAAGVWDVPTATNEINSFVDAAGLPEEVSKVFKREGMRAVEASRLEYLRVNNPQQFLKDVLKYMPNSPSANAGKFQQMAIEQATAHGVDPLTILTIGQIESGWNPNAKASKTIFGLYQISAALRKELGIPEHLKGDPALQTEGIIRLVKAYQENLINNKIEVSPVTTWASHFLGRAGVVAFWNADPNADAYQVFKGVAGPGTARLAFSSNGDLLKPGMTVGQVRAKITRYVANGMTKAKTYLTQKPNYDQTEPIEIAGEKFGFLNVGDLGPQYSNAAADVAKANETRFDAMNKLAIDEGAINSYTDSGRKLINDSVAKSNLPLELGQQDPAAFRMAENYIKKFNFLPKPLAQQALAMVAGNNADAKAAGYDLLYTAHATDTIRGLENSGVTGEMKQRIETYGNLRSVYGLSEKEAVAQTERVFSEEYKAKAGNVDEKKLRKERDALNWSQIEKAVDLNKGWLWWNTDATPNDTAKAAILNRYKSRFEQHYRATQDRDVARANAIADIANSHGITNTMPRPQFVLYPPERFLPPGKDGTHKYVGEQVTEYVNDYLDDLAKSTNDESVKRVDRTKISIAGTPDTGYDIQAGRLPRYEVFYVDNSGSLQMIPGAFVPNPARANGFNDAGVAGEKDKPEPKKPEVDIGALRKKRNEEAEAKRKAFKNPRGL
jgi:hypothetical protein